MATPTTYGDTMLLNNKILLSIAMSNSQKSLKDLRGKISFSDNYDYKSMRV